MICLLCILNNNNDDDDDNNNNWVSVCMSCLIPLLHWVCYNILLIGDDDDDDDDVDVVTVCDIVTSTTNLYF